MDYGALSLHIFTYTFFKVPVKESMQYFVDGESTLPGVTHCRFLTLLT